MVLYLLIVFLALVATWFIGQGPGVTVVPRFWPLVAAALLAIAWGVASWAADKTTADGLAKLAVRIFFIVACVVLAVRVFEAAGVIKSVF